MRRRKFITLIGGAVTWPLAAPAQQAERVKRIGVLSHLSENDPTAQQFVAAFRQRLQELGWEAGRNARIDIRWARATTPFIADTRRKWSLRRPMSFSRRRPRPCWR